MGLLDSAYEELRKPRALGLRVGDFVPYVSGLLAADDARLAAQQGNYGEAAGALAGLVPGGRIAQKAIGKMTGGKSTGQIGQTLGAIMQSPYAAAKAKPPKVEALARKSDKFLYHSATAKDAENLKYGIEASNEGPWIREVAQGATDDVDELLSNSTPLLWMSDEPTWVKVKVAREIGKPVKDITADDVERYGHVALMSKKQDDLNSAYRIGSEGLMNGSGSMVTDIKGRRMPAWQTDIYQENSYGGRMEPFGVERDEWVSTKDVEPMYQLTGKELVQFMRLKGLLD